MIQDYSISNLFLKSDKSEIAHWLEATNYSNEVPVTRWKLKAKREVGKVVDDENLLKVYDEKLYGNEPCKGVAKAVRENWKKKKFYFDNNQKKGLKMNGKFVDETFPFSKLFQGSCLFILRCKKVMCELLSTIDCKWKRWARDVHQSFVVWIETVRK